MHSNTKMALMEQQIADGMQFVVLFMQFICYSGFTYMCGIFLYTLATVIVLIIEPYKLEYAWYNIFNCLQFLWLALFCTLVVCINFSGMFQHVNHVPSTLPMISVSSAPIFYAVFIEWFCCKLVCRKCHTETDTETSLPHCITHSYEYR